MEKITKPEYKWYYTIPFTRGRKDYIKDRDLYEKQFLTRIELIRKKQMHTIDSLSVFIILLITSLWSAIPPLVNLPNSMDWMYLGLHGYGNMDWADHTAFFFVPSVSGTLLHNFHKLMPSKKIEYATNAITKSIPILILIICWYLIKTEKEIWKIKKNNKINDIIKKDNQYPQEKGD